MGKEKRENHIKGVLATVVVMINKKIELWTHRARAQRPHAQLEQVFFLWGKFQPPGKPGEGELSDHDIFLEIDFYFRCGGIKKGENELEAHVDRVACSSRFFFKAIIKKLGFLFFPRFPGCVFVAHPSAPLF